MEKRSTPHMCLMNHSCISPFYTILYSVQQMGSENKLSPQGIRGIQNVADTWGAGGLLGEVVKEFDAIACILEYFKIKSQQEINTYIKKNIRADLASYLESQTNQSFLCHH